MKNIHVLPTDKSSRLSIKDSVLILHRLQYRKDTQHIYITSDEEIKEGDWVIQVNFEKTNTQLIQCATEFQVKIANDKDGSFTKKKIILTTDQELIKDGVQAINDESLEWFVKNPSCEWVKVELHVGSLRWSHSKNTYEIIIPKGTLEKTAVEWLEFRYKNNITLNQYDFEEAKKIEEENICDAYNEGLYAWDNTDDFVGIDYYNKKFKNK